MAKPDPHDTPATRNAPQPRPSPSRRHRRKIHLSRCLPTCQATPSSSILALLGTVAAATCTVDGHPLPTQTPPPDFLCPGLDLYPAPTQPPTPRATVPLPEIDDDSQVPRFLTQAFLVRENAVNLQLAPKYVQGNDGLWRKTDHYSLYGSMVCVDPPCSDMALPTSSIVPDDPSASPQSTSIFPGDVSLPTPQVDAGSLPPGWSKSSDDDHDLLTPIITVLSLVLAMGICLFISGCVVWRKKRRTQRMKDPEKRDSRDSLSDSDSEQEDADKAQRVRRQKRLWAKASARWRANMRPLARRRRKRPVPSVKDDDDQPLSDTSSMLPSASSTSLRNFSLLPDPALDAASLRSSASSITAPHSPASSATQSRCSSPSRPSPSLPPAYLFSSPASPVNALNRRRAQFSERRTSSEMAEPPLAHGSHVLCPSPPPRTASSPPPADGIHAAHLAIDDKAVLARMAEYASVPPPEGSDPMSDVAGESSAAYASVPPLEEDFEDIPFPIRGSLDSEPGEAPANLGRSFPLASESHLMLTPDADDTAHAPSYEAGPSRLSHLLPPPPTKLPASMFYEYAPSFEDDIVNVEPVMGPSAPPFEDQPPDASAPPLAYDYMLDATVLPSAPDLVDDETGSIEPGHDPHDGHSFLPQSRPGSACAARPRSLSTQLGSPSGQSRTSGIGPPCYPA